MKGSFGFILVGLVGLAKNTPSDVFFNISPEGVSAVVSLDQFDSFHNAWMASKRRIVIFGYNFGPIMELGYECGTNGDVRGGVGLESCRPKVRGNADNLFIVMVPFVDIEGSR
jgi:hypothetical protein